MNDCTIHQSLQQFELFQNEWNLRQFLTRIVRIRNLPSRTGLPGGGRLYARRIQTHRIDCQSPPDTNWISVGRWEWNRPNGPFSMAGRGRWFGPVRTWQRIAANVPDMFPFFHFFLNKRGFDWIKIFEIQFLWMGKWRVVYPGILVKNRRIGFGFWTSTTDVDWTGSAGRPLEGATGTPLRIKTRGALLIGNLGAVIKGGGSLISKNYQKNWE